MGAGPGVTIAWRGGRRYLSRRVPASEEERAEPPRCHVTNRLSLLRCAGRDVDRSNTGRMGTVRPAANGMGGGRRPCPASQTSRACGVGRRWKVPRACGSPGCLEATPGDRRTRFAPYAHSRKIRPGGNLSTLCAGARSLLGGTGRTRATQVPGGAECWGCRGPQPSPRRSVRRRWSFARRDGIPPLRSVGKAP